MSLQHGKLNIGLQCDAPALGILVHQSLRGSKQIADRPDMQGITTGHISTKFDQRTEPHVFGDLSEVAQVISKSTRQFLSSANKHSSP